ncbi:FAD-binding oxidoreductase [Streptomyces sp. NPDC004284]|uniref:FAD-binding oxidoreductase n=1 Tax=Streptomyces sp. NPDC004284 TaxID=3364695 RepID=UPI00369EDDE1
MDNPAQNLETTPMSRITHHLTAEDLRLLRSDVAGRVLVPGDPELPEETAGFHLAATHHPVAVVAAASAQDVVTAVRWAAGRGIPVAVQATGHGGVSTDGALLITTRRLHQVTVDAERRVARVEAGATWREVIDAAAAHGLAPLSGSFSGVGAVGYTLGGGIGLLSREYGFAADHVLALDLVTADGRPRHVTADTEPDLFWAVRGGGGGFGVVTAFEVRLFPVPTLYAGGIFFAASSASEVLHAYRAWTPTLPESASSSVALLRMPPLEELPEPLRGKFVVHLRFSYNGPAEEGRALLAPMRAAGESVLGEVGELPFQDTDAVHQDPKDPMAAWHQGALLRTLDADTVDALLDAAGPQLNIPPVMVEIRQLGGALSRPATPPNAVAGRDGAYVVHVAGPLLPGLEDAVPATGNGILDALKPWTTGTALLNFLGEATAQDLAAAWGPDVHARLVGIKGAVDPGNLFRFGPDLGV